MQLLYFLGTKKQTIMSAFAKSKYSLLRFICDIVGYACEPYQ